MEEKMLINPYDQLNDFYCFGCSSKNPIGLKLSFSETESGLKSIWQPTIEFSGYSNILHGGIQSTLLDEIAAWTIYIKLDTAGVTSKLEIEFLKPMVIQNERPILLETEILSVSDRLATIKGKIINFEGQLCSQSMATFAIFPRNVAQRKFHFPGKDAFYKNM
ncbi:MAG TPA: PaaI family thioesterase [Salinivirgaceae bacterium]|nr:PaaI family thioesterase [Salinivirgaceae bacterium]